MRLSYFAFIFVLSAITYSCNKNIVDKIPPFIPQPTKPVIEEATYLLVNKEVIDFKVFEGSELGGIDVSKSVKPETYWNETKLGSFKFDTLYVRNDTIFESPKKYEKNIFKFKISQDTIYQWNRYAKFWTLYGLKKTDTIEHFVSYFTFQKTTPPHLYAENGHNDGLVDSSRYFGPDEYKFRTPKDMVSDNDLAAWYNIKYVFKKVNKKSN